MNSSVPAQERDAGLVRALGLRGMTFNTVNLVVGASIFVLPATVAGVLGPAAVIAYVVCAIAMAFVALCFAEAGSRVSTTGGVYAYAEAAFGPFHHVLVEEEVGVVAQGGAADVGHDLAEQHPAQGRSLALALVGEVALATVADTSAEVSNAERAAERNS